MIPAKVLSPRDFKIFGISGIFSGTDGVFPSAGEAALALRWKGFTLARLSAMEPAWMHALSGSMILISIGEIGNWSSIMDNAKAIPMN